MLLEEEDKQKNVLAMPRTYFFPQLQVQKNPTTKKQPQKQPTNKTHNIVSERQSTTHRDKKPHENQQTQ